MRKIVFFFLLYTCNVFTAALEEQKPVAALSSWGTHKGTCLINCSLNVGEGRLLGWLHLGESLLNHDVVDMDSMSHFDPLSVKAYIMGHFENAMKEVKKSKKPSTHYAWFYETFAKLHNDFGIEAKKRLMVQSIKAMQLAFFIGGSCSVIYACHKQDKKRIFPPIQLIEFFPDIKVCRDGLFLLTADAIAKNDGICEVHQFPSEEHRPLSVIYPKNDRSIQRIIDELVPRIFTREKRPFLGSESKGLIVALNSLYRQSKDVDDTSADQCIIA